MQQRSREFRIFPQREVYIAGCSVRGLRRCKSGHFQAECELRISGKSLEALAEILGRKLAVVIGERQPADREIGRPALGVDLLRGFQNALQHQLGIDLNRQQQFAKGHGLAGISCYWLVRLHLQGLLKERFRLGALAGGTQRAAHQQRQLGVEGRAPPQCPAAGSCFVVAAGFEQRADFQGGEAREIRFRGRGLAADF